MFFTGASGLVGEYILSTVATYILGNSIEQFSITIALMLGMMGVGGWVQKFISSHLLLEKLILIEVLLALLIGFAPIVIYGAFGYLGDHFNLILYFFILSIGFLIGFEIPLIIRLNESFSTTLKENLSTVISADYFGSLVGAMLWVYFLLPNFAITQSSFLISALNFSIAMMMALYFGLFKQLKHPILSAILLLLTVAMLIVGYTNESKWNLSLEQKLYDDKIVLSQSTRYQHLVMTHNKNMDEYRFYINGNVQFSSLDEKRYHEFLVHPVVRMNPEIRKVLILGGGDGLALRELNRYPDLEKVVLVDLDPEMVKIASQNTHLKALNKNAFENAKVHIGKSPVVFSGEVQKENTKLEVFHIDADRFLDELYFEKFDIVIIDFPDPNSIELTKLYSKEFYLKLKRLLKPSGSAVIQATSPYHAKEAFLCIRRTLESAGFNTVPYHYNIPSFGDWGWILFSQKPNLDYLLNVNNNFGVETEFLTPALFKASLQFGKGGATFIK
jgi:spermidine synthase